MLIELIKAKKIDFVLSEAWPCQKRLIVDEISYPVKINQESSFKVPFLSGFALFLNNYIDGGDGDWHYFLIRTYLKSFAPIVTQLFTQFNKIFLNIINILNML